MPRAVLPPFLLHLCRAARMPFARTALHRTHRAHATASPAAYRYRIRTATPPFSHYAAPASLCHRVSPHILPLPHARTRRVTAACVLLPPYAHALAACHTARLRFYTHAHTFFLVFTFVLLTHTHTPFTHFPFVFLALHLPGILFCSFAFVVATLPFRLLPFTLAPFTTAVLPHRTPPRHVPVPRYHVPTHTAPRTGFCTSTHAAFYRYITARLQHIHTAPLYTPPHLTHTATTHAAPSAFPRTPLTPLPRRALSTIARYYSFI